MLSNFQALAETQSCKRTRLDTSGFTTSRAAESWYPKNLYVNTYYDTKTANFNGRNAKLVIRDDKKRMHAVFKLKSSNGQKRSYKIVFLPNGEVHINLGAVGGFNTAGGAVYQCSNWYKNKIINTSGIKNNSNNFNPKNSSSTKFSSNTNRISDEAICNMATDRGSWRTVRFAQEYIQEAKSRGLNCGVASKKTMSSSTYSNLSNFSDWRVCDEVKLGKEEWLQEAKSRRLNCGVASEKVKKEKAREKRIKAEQEKIKKKAAEKALKKKLAEKKIKAEQEKVKDREEKFRKENIARIKREAKKREEEEKKLKNKISELKKEAKFFYQDVTEFVKSGGEIDLVKLTNLFSNRPMINTKWSAKNTKNYENLRSFMTSNQAFIDFERTLKQIRIVKANTDKNNIISSLNDNLKKLKTLLRENFGDDKVIKKIQLNIKRIEPILNEDFNPTKAREVLQYVNNYLSDYYNLKKELGEINSYLDKKKLVLSEIIQNNFGTEKAKIAAKLITNTDKTLTVESKRQIKNEIDIFIKNPSKKVKKISEINKQNKLKSKFSNLLDNQICNNAVRNNVWISSEKDLIAEAKSRGLDCGINVKTEIQNSIEKSKKRILKKSLGPCANVSGVWGKVDCLAVLDMLPMTLVCTGILTDQGYNGTVEIKISEHDKISYNMYGILGKVKSSENNLLVDGAFKFVFFSYDMKVKIAVGLLSSTALYEQSQYGRYVHSGYCQKRL